VLILAFKFSIAFGLSPIGEIGRDMEEGEVLFKEQCGDEDKSVPEIVK
jgi:hypothetical protein